MSHCKCSFGGPMKVERNEIGCPIHGTDLYQKLQAAWSAYGWRLADPVRNAIENGGDVGAAITKARQRLNQLEAVWLERSAEQ